MLPTTTQLYSADDHMIEPAHLWVDRVPERFKDRCPRIVDPGNGRQAWLFEDELVYIPMGSCRPLEGFPVQGFPPAPGTARFDEIRPGCYDPVARSPTWISTACGDSFASPTTRASPDIAST